MAYSTAALDAEDAKMFFLARKKFAPEDEKIDESTYDTKSYATVDLYPYLVTMGYKTEKTREKTTLENCDMIQKKRAEYGLSKLVDMNSKSKIPIGTKTIPTEEWYKEWKIFSYGTGNGDLPVVWNSSGNVSKAFMKKMTSTEENAEMGKIYCVNAMEQLARTKLKLSNKHKKRITKHYAVMDMANMGVTNFGTLKNSIGAAVGDAQVMWPETLEKNFFVNCGWTFRAIFTIAKNFIDPITREKMVICKDFKALVKELKDNGIPENMIPESFGGTAKGEINGGDFVFDHPDYKDPEQPKKEEPKKEESAPKEAPGGGEKETAAAEPAKQE